MTSPAHRLTSTGRLVVNLVLAVLIYLALSLTPEVPYKSLVGLIALALLATFIGGMSVSLPQAKPAAARKAGNRQEGSVKWFNTTKGFGFITGDDGSDIFLHFRQVTGLGKRDIKQGQRVSFVVAESDRGPQAEDVQAL